MAERGKPELLCKGGKHDGETVSVEGEIRKGRELDVTARGVTEKYEIAADGLGNMWLQAVQ
jgi:hypothetical protein